LQERKGGAFVIATINRIDGLPPELLRKGRVDEIFFVDLPDENEREEILRIHITKRGRDAEKLSKDSFWKDCIKHSKSFSGAELEEAVITGLYKAFHHDRKKDLQMVYVDSAILNTTPLAKSQAQNLSGMLEWAKAHAVPANKHKEETDAVKLQRSLDL
jgi:SpoVK/Ycf46/Vps4 family AAA+-type ATPase